MSSDQETSNVKSANDTEKSKAKVISFINMKGGVGKTTLSIGVASYLSEEQDKKVLVIDADPQFNATQSLLDDYKKRETKEILDNQLKIMQAKDGKTHTVDEIDDSEYNFYSQNIIKGEEEGKLENVKTIYRLFVPQVNLMNSFKMPSKEDLITPLTKNLDLLAGDLTLVLVNKSSDASFTNRIKRFIDTNNLRDEYQYIIIDCPPTLTIYTDSALLASDYYIIPNRIDRYSIIGIDSLQRSVSNLTEEVSPNLYCLGIIYTMVPTNMGKKQLKLQSSFESKKAVNSLDIFDSQLKEFPTIQNGVAGTNPISYTKSKTDIGAIVGEMVERIKQRENEEFENDRK